MKHPVHLYIGCIYAPEGVLNMMFLFQYKIARPLVGTHPLVFIQLSILHSIY